MSTRSQELNTIGDMIASVMSAKIYKIEIPKEYELNSVTIRGLTAVPNGLNGAYYSNLNTYQIMYFGDSYTNVAIESEKFSDLFSSLVDMKTKLRGSDEYVTIKGWDMSAPFKTDTDGVYGIIGILQLKSVNARPQAEHEKMQEIYHRIYRRRN